MDFYSLEKRRIGKFIAEHEVFQKRLIYGTNLNHMVKQNVLSIIYINLTFFIKSI